MSGPTYGWVVQLGERSRARWVEDEEGEHLSDDPTDVWVFDSVHQAEEVAEGHGAHARVIALVGQEVGQ